MLANKIQTMLLRIPLIWVFISFCSQGFLFDFLEEVFHYKQFLIPDKEAQNINSTLETYNRISLN